MSDGKKEILLGDCLELMKDIPDGSIDMILCDLPYGTTNCKWDTIIPFDKLWKQYERIIKSNGVIALTATQPFASLLITSNLKLFKQELIWDKVMPVGHLIAGKRIMSVHENILLFYSKQPTFNRQFTALNLLNDSVTSCRDDLIPSISTSLCFCVGIASSLAVASSIVSSSFITAKPNALFNALTKFFANFMFTFF